jgi:hypothetical protein
MYSPTLRPKWWQLYLIFPLLAVLFLIDNRLNLSSRGHIAVQLGILLLVFGLIHLWIRANSAALSHLSRMDQGHYQETITVIRIPPHQFDDEKRPLFQRPDSEIKGVLSDTFEMDYIDAEFLPGNELPQEIDKD